MEKEGLFKTKRGKALKKLLIWGVFLLIIFAVFKIANTNNDNKQKDGNKITEVNYKEALLEIKNSSFEYTYNILVDENEYTLNGFKTSESDSGTMQIGEETINYSIDADGFQLMTEDEEDTKKELFNIDYLNLKFIDTLMDNKPVMIDSGFEYPGDDVTYIFNCDGNHVSSILITSSNYIYDMHINNIMPN